MKFRSILASAVLAVASSVTAQAENWRLAVTDVEGMERLQLEWGPFKDALETATGQTFEFFAVNSRTAAAEALSEETVDFVVSGPAEYVVINKLTQATPLIGLGSPDYQCAIVVRADGGINVPTDLKGKKVGYSVGGFEDALLAAMLKQEGLSLDDVELININFSLSPSLITGAVDAVIGAFRNFELNQLDIEKRPGIAFYPEENGVPVYDELIFIAKSDRANDPRFRPFMDTVEKATLYLTNHSDDALAQFMSAEGDQLILLPNRLQKADLDYSMDSLKLVDAWLADIHTINKLQGSEGQAGEILVFDGRGDNSVIFAEIGRAHV